MSGTSIWAKSEPLAFPDDDGIAFISNANARGANGMTCRAKVLLDCELCVAISVSFENDNERDRPD